ncbi:MAG: bifunctional DNA-formamidopyrimidine glycosylase/DNA-(apurinic or apyrimidinic site) lyase [Verrucomicrobiae bacterium]|nr:bifunctional DNA-formamidopyrimidine glycosylase/DNA-(apurinic or apyrimidinic site) lyase [Verrucomicrobiae bacterium]
MPELPEVEVLCRHLAPRLCGRVIGDVVIVREKVVRPTAPADLRRALSGATITGLDRRGKYLLFHLDRNGMEQCLIGHLGMTGRMFLQSASEPAPKHTAVHFELGRERFIYRDTRCFGRFTLDLSGLEKLGPEPLSEHFRPEAFRDALRKSRQPVKVKVMDQSLVAGVGNIYASEALHRAGISPRAVACRLSSAACYRLAAAIRSILGEAIEKGSGMSLDFSGDGAGDGFFYYGRSESPGEEREEGFRVYDREGEPCRTCEKPIRRIVQAARSTFYCPRCQGAGE